MYKSSIRQFITYVARLNRNAELKDSAERDDEWSPKLLTFHMAVGGALIEYARPSIESEEINPREKDCAVPMSFIAWLGDIKTGWCIKCICDPG